MQQPEITTAWLAEQLAIAERATREPWTVEGERNGYQSISSEKWQQLAEVVVRLDGDPLPNSEGAANAAFIAAARTGYPAVLRKLMEARDETPFDYPWLLSVGFVESVKQGERVLVLDCPKQGTRLTQVIARPIDMGGFWIILRQAYSSHIEDWETIEDDCEYSDVLIDATTRAAVLALLAAIGVGAKGG